ncbi:thiamine pyrophosphate-dependent enzyme [Nesterenkonia flava]|uniref:2-oxoisovalerate dehydrogenase subunit alpha n=1 Tax=Nesterenkonia flava TaxID=469799 RepID=A0ABU1FVM2_9MICC|nr:thiamine pyrophosphate-dependent enzyme [Nesterenkonia flava]MDR5712731.1 thiamine pyrophosphate-dependent enzyme [Nesterenkonia flava]
MEPIQLLAPDGSLREHELYSAYLENLSDEDLRQLYRHMAVERRFDQEATSLQRQGQLALWVPAWGQEAAQVGTIAALKPTDRVFPTYREHAMALYRGISPEELMATFRTTKHSGWDPNAYNFHIYAIVLASQTLHAAGWAMGIQQDLRLGLLPRDRAEDELVLTCLGDGASSQGDVHESMVFASSYQLPMLYFLQNNHWAISVPAATQSRTPLVHRATGYGFEGVRVDGNDVLASYAVAAQQAEQIRAGAGPKLIESVTYRMGAHTTADDPTKYRPSDEVDAWSAKDPIARYQKWLLSTEKADDAYFAQVAEEGNELASELRQAVTTMESIDIERVFDTVYAEPHRQIEVEKNWLKEYEAGFVEEETP